ncbi:MAG TPA: hypothetical protein VFE38_00295 [Edaphobacter sp.]|nr:hypothetical protein [Edaphobacter sp.]
MENALGPIVVFSTIAWIAWLTFSSIRRYKIAKLQAGVQMKLLEKIDSSQSLLTYVETEPGRNFLSSLAVEQAQKMMPYKSILSGVYAGIILIALGIALVLLRSVAGDAAQACRFFGTLSIALGIGFEIASVVTYFLSQSFGLVNRDGRA